MIARRFYFYKEKREKENNLECKMNLKEVEKVCRGLMVEKV